MSDMCHIRSTAVGVRGMHRGVLGPAGIDEDLPLFPELDRERRPLPVAQHGRHHLLVVQGHPRLQEGGEGQDLGVRDSGFGIGIWVLGFWV